MISLCCCVRRHWRRLTLDSITMSFLMCVNLSQKRLVLLAESCTLLQTPQGASQDEGHVAISDNMGSRDSRSGF